MNIGKAFEYICLISLSNFISNKGENNVEVVENGSYSNSYNFFKELQEADSQYVKMLQNGAHYLCETLYTTEPKLFFHEPEYENKIRLQLQSDSAGRKGDVRDIVIQKNSKSGRGSWEIGISCKHNNNAVKHSRVSETIDFGLLWLNYPLTEGETHEIKKVFSQIDDEVSKGFSKWSEIQEKTERYYKPLLRLIINKINLIRPDQGSPSHLLHYLIGIKDFYKIMVDKHGLVEIEGMNINGELNHACDKMQPTIQVPRLNLPTKVLKIDMKEASSTTLHIHFDNSWALSMRIHSASKRIEKSLKMDVRFITVPENLLSIHEAI